MNTGSSAIVIHNKKILLLLRDNIPTILYPNKWSLPGGCTEIGETPKQTLLRELDEEICVKPKNIKSIGQYTDKGDMSTDYLFVVNLDDFEASQVKLGNEGQELKFFALNEIENIRLTPILKKNYFLYKEEIRGLVERGEVNFYLY